MATDSYTKSYISYYENFKFNKSRTKCNKGRTNILVCDLCYIYVTKVAHFRNLFCYCYYYYYYYYY